MKTIVYKEHIVSALKQLGLAYGDCTVVHSSLSSFGFVDGGPDAVIDAFIEVIGSEGTLVMPALCQKDKERRFETWDIAKSHSDVGKITEIFRLRPESMRSDHPTHSVSAYGRLAHEITAGHGSSALRPGPWGGKAFGVHSPWQKLYEINAGIIMVGVDFKVITIVHLIEHLIAERALLKADISKRIILEEELYGWNKPGVWAGFDRLKLQKRAEASGLISQTYCGDSLIMMVFSHTLVDFAIEIMERSPSEWFSDEFCSWLEKAKG